MLGFTRNPFLLVEMSFGHFIKHRRNSKGFRVFQNISKQTRDAFAWLRTNGIPRACANGMTNAIAGAVRVVERGINTGYRSTASLTANL
jgi:hypothetical protein